MRKPSVIVRCVANQHTGPTERIIEFSSEAGGGLISFRVVDGRLIVDVYRTDDTVDVLPTRRPTSKAVRKAGKP